MSLNKELEKATTGFDDLLKCSGIEYVATGRFAIDVVVKNPLSDCEVFSVYISRDDEEKYLRIKESSPEVFKRVSPIFVEKLPESWEHCGFLIPLQGELIRDVASRYYDRKRDIFEKIKNNQE